MFRTALWIVGEYATSKDDVDYAFTKIKESIGSVPFIQEEEQQEKKEETPVKKDGKVILYSIILISSKGIEFWN